MKIIFRDKRKYFKLKYVYACVWWLVGKTIVITLHYLQQGSSSASVGQWKISRRSRLRIAEKKTDKLRAAAKLCLRGTRGSKIRNRPRNQIVRRDNDDAGQRARRHRSDCLIFDCCVWYGDRFSFIAWTRFR